VSHISYLDLVSDCVLLRFVPIIATACRDHDADKLICCWCVGYYTLGKVDVIESGMYATNFSNVWGSGTDRREVVFSHAEI
jgi:hypothetical protein